MFYAKNLPHLYKFQRAQTDLNEHELLHRLHPLQQHDARLERSTQVLMSRVRVTDCRETKPLISPVSLRCVFS